MPNFKSSLNKFSSALEKIPQEEVKDPNILDFKQKKQAYQLTLLKTSFKELTTADLSYFKNQELTQLVSELKEHFEDNNLQKLKEIVKKLQSLESTLNYPKIPKSLQFRIPNLPNEIIDDVKADLNELEKCFQSKCYRASVILCGRLLETSLHRKYFEVTKFDILEKNPGIGLGTLVAKMKEKNITLDPAITQQIHLINQVRIYSVHTKKESFLPNKDQTHAIILYTIDIIKKLFK